MSKYEGEQAMEKPEAERAERKEDLAGFKDSSALAAAYKSLQAEFTRKSQRMKDMERELNEVKSGAEVDTEPTNATAIEGDREGEFEAFLKQFPQADHNLVVKGVITNGDYSAGSFTREYVRQLKAEIDALKAENSSEEAITQKAMASGKITEAIVKEYLKAISASVNALPPVADGYEPVLPPSKPKSIREAGKMAGDIFKIING